MVIYLAGLQDVPEHLYEAADLDGAHWLQKIRHVTLPMLSPVILFNLIIGIIGTFQFFAIPFVMAPNGHLVRRQRRQGRDAGETPRRDDRTLREWREVAAMRAAAALAGSRR